MTTEKLICPNNPKHKLFYATATVQEEWVVNEYLDWEETVAGASEPLRYPEFSDDFSCVKCSKDDCGFFARALVQSIPTKIPAGLKWCASGVDVTNCDIHEWMPAMEHTATFYAKARKEWNDERKMYIWFGDEVEPVGGVYDWRKCITQQLMAEAEGLA